MTDSPEAQVRKKLRAPVSLYKGPELFQLLFSFWHHFNLFKRRCDKTNSSIITPFSEECPYPVWKRSIWLSDNAPPVAEYTSDRPFFEQLSELFYRCPIPHNIGVPGDNCEFTDDWWYCKNCFLCHSGLECEDLRYCYRTYRSKDSRYCVSSFFSELCSDVVYSEYCFDVFYAIDAHRCKHSAYLFDCRDCSHCTFCWNLRNAEYCFENKQLSKTEYLAKMETVQKTSRRWCNDAEQHFRELLRTRAWLRALAVEKCE